MTLRIDFGINKLEYAYPSFGGQMDFYVKGLAIFVGSGLIEFLNIVFLVLGITDFGTFFGITVSVVVLAFILFLIYLTKPVSIEFGGETPIDS